MYVPLSLFLSYIGIDNFRALKTKHIKPFLGVKTLHAKILIQRKTLRDDM